MTNRIKRWLAYYRMRSLEINLATPPFLGFIAKEGERRILAELPGSLERFRALVEAEPA